MERTRSARSGGILARGRRGCGLEAGGSGVARGGGVVGRTPGNGTGPGRCDGQNASSSSRDLDLGGDDRGRGDGGAPRGKRDDVGAGGVEVGLGEGDPVVIEVVDDVGGAQEGVAK